ncbi:hypothetical protein CCHL11_08052 [Colletotrichum chlorophyti]|uniref:Uncharacterized protein n=1 Tax=Colletotrichum chlorophyti TaxID=708187 RepID=A0A1Q8RMC5_9PEZI|nr:hypothetical protein CCHL11_08052 [Colletotrichum chlorophyti]
MRRTTSLVLLCPLALCAPDTPITKRAETFEVDRFYAGGLQQNRNFVMFSIRPTPGADFANCTVNTGTGAAVPTIPRRACSDINSITWSLEPMGDGMHFSVWWAFTGVASLFGERHLPAGDFRVFVMDDGSKSQHYIGEHRFGLNTTTVMKLPGGGI